MNVLIAVIARGAWQRCEVGQWVAYAYASSQLGGMALHVTLTNIDQEPTPVARNQAVKVARENGADALFMLDDDMVPSMSFFPVAAEHLQRNPCSVIGSPYCGIPPRREVQVMDTINDKLCRVDRNWAKTYYGIRTVSTIGTGCIGIGMKAFRIVKPPYFAYEYADAEQTAVSMTEDFVFTRNLTKAGGKVWCAWDHWSAHAKTEIVGKPE